MTQQINQAEFEEKVLKGEGVVLADFFATWCGPCKMLAPVLSELSEEGYTIYSIDVDQETELAGQYSIMSVPTMMIFKDGEVVDQMVGLMPKENIKAKLDYYNN